ncbi:hypothetical protein RZS08_01990, partial [Arthrospira platensis SPKY1]|nr:hypothetical protein [Arthrospira platensis SPKY1]
VGAELHLGLQRLHGDPVHRRRRGGVGGGGGAAVPAAGPQRLQRALPAPAGRCGCGRGAAGAVGCAAVHLQQATVDAPAEPRALRRAQRQAAHHGFRRQQRQGRVQRQPVGRRC